MANAVYDDKSQKNKSLKEYDPDRVPDDDEMAQRTGIDGNEALKHAEDEAGNKTKKASDDNQDSEEESQALNDKLGEPGGPSNKETETGSSAGFYKSDDGSGSGFLASFSKKKKRGAAVAGTSVIIIILGIGSLGSFFNVFKFHNLISNIDAKTFSRLNGVEDRRTLAWMKAYMEVRLMDYGDNADMTPGREQNAFFKAGRVQTGSPLADWYRTMRQSKFEDRMFQNSGVKFTSILTPNGQLKTGRIDISKSVALKSSILAQTYNITPADYAAIQKGDLKALQKYQHLFDVTVFNSDSELRTTLAKDIRDNTRSWEIFQRRHIRKAEQNTIGARSWRFFEKSREQARQNRVDIRNKIILKAIPETTKSGSLIHCILANTCKGDGDAGNRSTNGVDNPNVTASGKTEKELAQSILKKLGLFSTVINITQTLDTISNIDKLVASGALVAYIAQSRGQQALGLYQLAKTASDQSRTGELTGPEFNSFMQVFSTAASSEAQTKVINNKGDPNTLNQTPEAKKYCSTDHQEWMRLPQNQAAAAKEFAYLCPDQMIGGPSRAADITQGYNENLRPVIHPFAQQWDSVRHSLIVGTILDIISSITGWLSDIASSIVLSVADLLGFSDDIHKLMEWMGNFALGFLGGGPMLNGGEPPGIFMNVIMQGAAYGAETSSRQMGAALSNQSTVASNNTLMAGFYQQNNQQMSAFQKYFSLSNPDSIGTHSTLAISNLGSSSFSNILSSLSNGFFGVFSNFTAKAKAAGEDSRRGAVFAGIEQYDFPAACTETDPMNIQKPSDASNIGTILGPQAATALDQAGWEVATDSAKYYDFLYGQTSDAKLIKKVYNCNLLDNSIRGSTGFLFGYKNDHGLEDGGGVTSAATPTSTPTNPSGGGNPTVSVNGYTWPVDLSKAEVSSGYPWPCPGNCHHDNTPAFDLSNKAAVADSSGAHDNTAVGRAELAITDGTINNLHLYQGIAGCYSFHIVSSLDGYDYYYTHTRNPVVVNGQTVKSGDKVSEIGERRCTGNGSYPHLHIDRGFPKGAGGGNVCCRDPGMVPLINSLYAKLP